MEKFATQDKMSYEDFVADVDDELPERTIDNSETFAIVIANEKYKEVASVAYAENDGQVMVNYLHKTIGIPERNILFYENASSVEMKSALKKLSSKTEALLGIGKPVKVIYYYSGHGVPDENGKDAYLLPVDVPISEINDYAISLNQLYTQLGSIGAESITVLLDACFSGAGKDDKMLANVKGVALEPKEASPKGNMIVLSACSGDQTAHFYEPAKHGLFTYWLLRKLKETKGDVTLGDLAQYIQGYVRYTASTLDVEQSPTIRVSPLLQDRWNEIRFINK